MAEQELLRQFVLPSARETGKNLGVGAYGSVEELEVDGIVCAGKRIHEALLQACNEGVQNVTERFIQECRLMSDLRHPQVVQFLGVCFLPPQSRVPMLVMEYLPSSLEDLLESANDIPLCYKRTILHDVALGLSFLHGRDPPIIHRDLTAKNVLLTPDMRGKIADLGVARILNIQPGKLETTLTRVPGTTCYMPPEAFSHYTTYNSSIDIFSFGHLTLYTLTQSFPNVVAATYINEDGQLLAQTEIERRGEAVEKLRKQLGNHHPFVSLIVECLQNNHKKRPSSKQVTQTLEEMKSVIPDPYAKMLRLHLTQHLSQKEAECQQQAKEIETLKRENQQQAKEIETFKGENQRLQGVVAVLQRRLDDLQVSTDTHATAQKPLPQLIGEREEPEGNIETLPSPLPSPDHTHSPPTLDYSSDSDPPDHGPTTSHPIIYDSSSDSDVVYEFPPDSQSPSDYVHMSSKYTFPERFSRFPYAPPEQNKSQAFFGKNPDVLFYLQNSSTGDISGVKYDLGSCSVVIEAKTESELQESVTRFQRIYKEVSESETLKLDEVQVPQGIDKARLDSLVAYHRKKHTSCAITYLEHMSVIRFASMSAFEFDHLKQILPLAVRNLMPTSLSGPQPPMQVLHLSNQRMLKIKNGNLSEEDANVIVNSTNSGLRLHRGLAGLLNELTHGELQKKCDKYRREHGSLQLGNVAITELQFGKDSELNCDWVIHAASPTMAHSPPVCKKALGKIVKGALFLADERGAFSIAFPPLSTGGCGVDKSLVAKVLIDEIADFTYLHPNTLVDIRIVIKEEHTFDCFVQYLKIKQAHLLRKRRSFTWK